jgi:hypothetical protein
LVAVGSEGFRFFSSGDNLVSGSLSSCGGDVGDGGVDGTMIASGVNFSRGQVVTYLAGGDLSCRIPAICSEKDAESGLYCQTLLATFRRVLT